MTGVSAGQISEWQTPLFAVFEELARVSENDVVGTEQLQQQQKRQRLMVAAR